MEPRLGGIWGVCWCLVWAWTGLDKCFYVGYYWFISFFTEPHLAHRSNNLNSQTDSERWRSTMQQCWDESVASSRQCAFSGVISQSPTIQLTMLQFLERVISQTSNIYGWKTSTRKQEITWLVLTLSVMETVKTPMGARISATHSFKFNTLFPISFFFSRVLLASSNCLECQDKYCVRDPKP